MERKAVINTGRKIKLGKEQRSGIGAWEGWKVSREWVIGASLPERMAFLPRQEEVREHADTPARQRTGQTQKPSGGS